MNPQSAKKDTSVGASIIISTVIHVAVFLLLVWWGMLFPPHMKISETYVVDVVNLPVADPRSGNPEQTADSAAAVPAPAPPQPMAVPSAASKTVAKPSPQDAAEIESAFAERMARIERNSEARHEESVLEKLRSRMKVGSSKKTGTPGATGAEAGSRYADYIKSRLEEALKLTSSYTTRNPEVAVRLTIAADGRLLAMKIEHSSGDAAFELAVRRAIDLASAAFTAPPDHSVFENGFVFKPKGISNRASR